jgi:hypothetical protein
MAGKFQFNLRNALLATLWFAVGFGVLAAYRDEAWPGRVSEGTLLAAAFFLVGGAAMLGRAREAFPIALVLFLLLAAYFAGRG